MKHILLIASVFLIGSCSQSTSLKEGDKSVIIEEVQKTLNQYHDDIRKSGLTEELRYLDNSADFFWVPPGYLHAISYDSVVAVLKQNAPRFKSIDNSFDTLLIIPISREIATYTGRLSSIMRDTMNASVSFSLIETGVMIKRKDGWKLFSGQTSAAQ